MKITNQNPTAVIFHRNPEPRSEPLALEQANYFCRYEPYYASDSPTTPENRICTIASQDRYAQPDLQRGMGSAARENVCSNFNLRLQTARLENVYLEAAREHARGRAGQ